jgi:hypothetical protein
VTRCTRRRNDGRIIVGVMVAVARILWLCVIALTTSGDERFRGKKLPLDPLQKSAAKYPPPPRAEWNSTPRLGSGRVFPPLLACLPRRAPGMCSGNRLRACPKGKRELKELWAQVKRRRI